MMDNVGENHHHPELRSRCERDRDKKKNADILNHSDSSGSSIFNRNVESSNKYPRIAGIMDSYTIREMKILS